MKKMGLLIQGFNFLLIIYIFCWHFDQKFHIIIELIKIFEQIIFMRAYQYYDLKGHLLFSDYFQKNRI